MSTEWFLLRDGSIFETREHGPFRLWERKESWTAINYLPEGWEDAIEISSERVEEIIAESRKLTIQELERTFPERIRDAWSRFMAFVRRTRSY